MENHSKDKKKWIIDGLTYEESCRQDYDNCTFATGTVEGHPIDTMYLELIRNGKTDVFLLLRPDEVAALAWVLNGVLWSRLIEDVPSNTEGRDCKGRNELSG
jgi:hypothetical protein